MTLKTVVFTPTCLGSCRNHQQGAILCLAKTTNVVSFTVKEVPSSTVNHTPAQQADMPP